MFLSREDQEIKQDVVVWKELCKEIEERKKWESVKDTMEEGEFKRFQKLERLNTIQKMQSFIRSQSAALLEGTTSLF